MTLLKQMLFFVGVIFIALFISIVFITTNTTRDYLNEQFSFHAQEAATSLGIVLKSELNAKQKYNNFSITKAYANHLFNSGKYQEIRISHFDDRVFFKKNYSVVIDPITTWFVSFFPLASPQLQESVEGGWKINIQINPSSAYSSAYNFLWKNIINSLLIYLSILLAILFVTVIFLKFIRQSLKNLDVLAKQIAIGEFDSIKSMPWITELRNVSLSMNNLSDAMRSRMSQLNSNLEIMSEQLSVNIISGLEQEKMFNAEMKQMFIKKADGYIFSVKIDKFSDFSKNNTNKNIDRLIRDIAQILKHSDETVKAYHFFSSIFAVISPQTDYEKIELIAKSMVAEFKLLGEKYGLSSIVHIGATPFNPISTTDKILTDANKAHEKAKLIGPNAYFIRNKNDLVKDMEIWKNLISDIIDNNKFNIGYINHAFAMTEERELLLVETFTSAADDENIAIPLGTFMSVAEKYNKIMDFDTSVILQVIDFITSEKINHKVLINLTFDLLMDKDFRAWIEAILVGNKEIASQLVFSVTAYRCVRDIEACKGFINLVHKHGAKFIIKRYETKHIPLEKLKELEVDYIRLSSDSTDSISSDSNKQNSITAICELSKSLNIKVFATHVNDEDDLSKLRELGVYGANINTILKYEGNLSQSIIAHGMNSIEEDIVNIGIMGKVATITVELLQNMMNYSKSKDLTIKDIVPAGFIEVIENKNHIYDVKSTNIVDADDKDKIESKLIEIQNLDANGIKKRYRELRRSGENTHKKGGGIGFFEIAKQVSEFDYQFIAINEQRYYFEYKASVKSRKR